MAKFNVKLKVTIVSEEVREIEADNLEDAEFEAGQLEEEYDNDVQLIITEVLSVSKMEEDDEG